MEDVTQKRTPGEWRELFSSQEFEEAYEYGGDDLGAVYQTQGQTLRSGPRRQSGQSFCCIGQEAQRRVQQSPLTGQKRVRTEKGVSVCIKTEIFQVLLYLAGNGGRSDTGNCRSLRKGRRSKWTAQYGDRSEKS